MTRWTFRPTVLQKANYCDLSVQRITDHYVDDNDRALKDGVEVPPPPPHGRRRRRQRRNQQQQQQQNLDSPINDVTMMSEQDVTVAVMNDCHNNSPASAAETMAAVLPSQTHHHYHHHPNHEETSNGQPGRVSPSPDCESMDTSTWCQSFSSRSSSSSSSSSSASSTSPSMTRPADVLSPSIVDKTNKQQSVPLRTLQWNIQAFTSPRDERNSYITNGIIQSISETDADVIVLNEYHWKDQHSSQQQFENTYLKPNGYNDYYCGSVLTPTLIASRFPVLQFEEIVLSYERSAMCIKIDTCDNNVNDHQCHDNMSSSTSSSSKTTTGMAWVIGTHLDAFDGKQRWIEMDRLLCYMKDHPSVFDPSIPILLMGDFNQQRQKDYTHAEWQTITSSMDRRSVCHDDGVASLLEDHGFRCVFDDVTSTTNHQQRTHDSDNNKNTAQTGDDDGDHQEEEEEERKIIVDTNWDTEYPPSTHWSGTTIDYTYAVGDKVSIDGVFISPVGFSDHRMTVCDWNVQKTTATTPTTSTTLNNNIVSSSLPVDEIIVVDDGTPTDV